jgi:hypothetical protein
MTDPSPASKEALHFQPEWCRVTRASIGDTVIADRYRSAALRHARVHLRFFPAWRHAAVRTLLRVGGWTVGYVIAIPALFGIGRAMKGGIGTASITGR